MTATPPDPQQTPPADSRPASASSPPVKQTGSLVAPEMLVPRLGDVLVEKGLLTAEQLQRALHEQAAAARRPDPPLLGEVLVEHGMIDRRTLDRAVTEQIINLQTALREGSNLLERRVEERSQDLQRRYLQIQTAAEVAQAAITATSLDQLLKTTVNAIVERFGYYHASIFLLDETNKEAVLREASGSIGKELVQRTYRLEVGSNSIIGWVTQHNQPRVVTDVSNDPFYLHNELLPQTRSEACLPLAAGSQMLGALDVQSMQAEAFPPEDLTILQILANQIAAGLQNLRLLDVTRSGLAQLNNLYQSSRQIAQAQTPEEILRLTAMALGQSPFISALLIAGRNGLRVAAVSDPQVKHGTQPLLNRLLPLFPAELESAFPANQAYVQVNQGQSSELPAELVDLMRKMGCVELAFLPVWRSQRIAAIAVLASRDAGRVTVSALQPYAYLAEFVSAALEKTSALSSTQEQLKRLEILSKVSQTIASETDLSRLYALIHQQIAQVMGDNTFYIALYEASNDTISFPYLFEDGQITYLAPIPVGEGLTSVVIRTSKPLMLVQDTARQAEALGARRVGKVAKSWLGVPLQIGEEVIGVMTVQNADQENAFDQEDLQLLSTLGSQVAVAIRNAALIETSRRRAERERLLFEVSDKIRASVDMQTILATTAIELGRALGARRTNVRIETPQFEFNHLELSAPGEPETPEADA